MQYHNGSSLYRACAGKQRGLALVSVLLVVAILVIIAADMLARQRVDMRGTQNTVLARQGWHYALGGERWAIQLLRRDLLTEASSRDHLGEPWAQSLHRFPFDEGELFVRIEDANARFNLNNLVAPNGQVSEIALRQWQGLLQDFDAQPALASELLAMLIGKAVNKEIGTGDPSSDSANSIPLALVDSTELLTLPSMNKAALQRLQPLLATVPGRIKLNVNTAKLPVLQHISPILGSEKLAMIKARQQQGGFATVDEFVLAAGGDGVFGDVISEFAVSSDFFIVMVRAEYAERTTYLQSLVYRDRKQNTVQIIQRQRLTELDDDILTDD